MSEKIDQDHNYNRSEDEQSLNYENPSSSETPEFVAEAPITTGIILFEMGNPHSNEEIETFLEEVFNDPNLVTSLSPTFWAEKYLLKIQPYAAPYLARYLNRHLIKKLEQNSEGVNWEQLHELVNEQARVLQECLLENGHRVKVLPTMRYGTPSIEDSLELAQDMGLEKLILMPLIPQFSWLTTGSFFQAFDVALEEFDLREDIVIRSIPHFYGNEYYIMALSQHIDQALEQNFEENIRYQIPLMFVARGIPEKMIREHDPYEHHLEQTMELVQEHLGIPNPVYLTYQGNLKPIQWMGPQTTSMIDYLADKDIPGMLFIPIGWSSEQFETQRLDQDVLAYAAQKGIEPLYRLQTLNLNKFFISALKQALINDLHVIENTSLTKT